MFLTHSATMSTIYEQTVTDDADSVADSKVVPDIVKFQNMFVSELRQILKDVQNIVYKHEHIAKT